MRELKGILLLRWKNRFYTSPLPCPAALRGVAHEIETGGKKQRQFNRKALTSSSAHVCAIGEVARSDGGVKKQKNDSVKRFLHSSPAFCNAKYRGRWHVVTEGLKNIRNRENVSRYQPSPPMCRKEIEVLTKQKGRSKWRFYPLPLLIADEIGGVPVGRGG